MERGERESELALPIRLTEEGTVATWNPGFVRATRVVLQVRNSNGSVSERVSMNSGRARVRVGERIEAVLAVVNGSSA